MMCDCGLLSVLYIHKGRQLAKTVFVCTFICSLMLRLEKLHVGILNCFFLLLFNVLFV